MKPEEPNFTTEMPVPIKEFEAELNRTNRVLHEFFKECDRAAAVLVAAEMDRVVLKLVESFLLPACDSSSPFLERNGPLEAFAIRVELLYRIGLIPPVMHHDLQLIRKIRNKFAHGPTGLDFNQTPVRELALKLVGGRQEMAGFLAGRKEPLADKANPFDPRSLFCITSSVLLPRLCLLQYQIPRLNPLWPSFFKSADTSQVPAPSETPPAKSEG